MARAQLRDLGARVLSRARCRRRTHRLRHIRTTRDGDFSRKRLADAYVSELAHQLGNLVQRTLALVARARDGVIPAPPEGSSDMLEFERDGARERELALHIEAVAHEVAAAVEGFALHEALESIWRLVAAAARAR